MSGPRHLEIVKPEPKKETEQQRWFRLHGYCSFCGKHKDEVDDMAWSCSSFICGECVTECVKIFRVTNKSKN